MDLKELKEILQILDEKEITEFELEEQGMKLRIRKATSANHATAPAAVAPLSPTLTPGMAHPPVAAMPSGVSTETPGAPALAEAEEGVTLVKSPIVGTFYRAADPNSPSFVNVGDHVRVGQILCIIEAMKLMNEIEAEVAGEILQIHRDNGQPVQYGEALFTVRIER